MHPTIEPDNPLLTELKRCIRIYGASSVETLANYLIERGVIPDSSLPPFLRAAVNQGLLREVAGVKQRPLYALPLEETL